MEFDVIVAGAGPAGAACALYLAKAGKRVLVLEREKFPRDKICADNQTWKCLDILKELGLWKEFEKLPKKEIKGVLVASPSGHEIYSPLSKKDAEKKGPWYNVRRSIFDEFLANACKNKKNIALRENCEVISPVFEEKKVVGVKFRNEGGIIETAKCKIVVGADGSNSAVAKSVGQSPVIRGRYAVNARAYFRSVSPESNRCELYYLKGICPGYFWIFPVDDGLYNVGIGMRPGDMEKGKTIKQKLLEVISSEKFGKRFEKAKQESEIQEWGVSVLGRKRKWSGNGFVLIGDAGTFAMTFSGEGVGPGMRSGKIAALAIAKAFERNDFSAKSLGEFDKTMWNILEPEIKGFRWLEFLILHEKIFDFAVNRAAKNRGLIELVSRMQNDYSLAQEIAKPSTLLKLLFPKN